MPRSWVGAKYFCPSISRQAIVMTIHLFLSSALDFGDWSSSSSQCQGFSCQNRLKAKAHTLVFEDNFTAKKIIVINKLHMYAINWAITFCLWAGCGFRQFDSMMALIFLQVGLTFEKHKSSSECSENWSLSRRTSDGGLQRKCFSQMLAGNVQ